MICPHCNSRNNRVLDSRPSADELSIRRRRECLDCGKSYRTVETIEGVKPKPGPKPKPVALRQAQDVQPTPTVTPPAPKPNNADKRRQLNEFMARYRDAQRAARER